jgi:hypothetical protein
MRKIDLISNWIKDGKTIIDMGCVGEGEKPNLHQLLKEKYPHSKIVALILLKPKMLKLYMILTKDFHQNIMESLMLLLLAIL